MRFINYLYAMLGGYFWRSCPRCGQMFGGHENMGSMVLGDKTFATCCPPSEGFYKGKIVIFKEQGEK